MYGVAEHVKLLQTATGVKDKIAQHWIEILLDKAKRMKSRTRSKEAVAAELKKWYDEQTGDKINPLLLLDGMTASVA